VSARRTLVLGWGNPGRRDDGLGPALAAALSGAEATGVTVESDYQLQPEDAAELARHEEVLFVDAARAGAEPFEVRRLGAAAAGGSFTSHSVSPGQLLAIARDLFGARPRAWLLGIRGYEFDEFGEGLSPRASANLAVAADCVRRALARAGGLGTLRPPAPRSPTTRP
jgi:hydrogenase maturation protease